VKIALAVSAAALLLAGAAYRSGGRQLDRPDPAELPVRGIDVSHHQGGVDWSKVAGAGIRFAYIKATEGRDLRDPRFEANWGAAAAAGIPRGAYHFFTFCSPGRAQAEHFLRSVPPTPGALTPVADVEFVGNCKSYGSLERVRGELRVFLDAVAKRWGTAPILYVTPDSHERVAAGRFGDHPVWIRSVVDAPAADAYGGWLIWQFSETGRIPGIQGPVDLNMLRPGVEIRGLIR
jgi:lysozyme